jgi:Amiloride-sensitive sodium channel
LSVIQKSQYLLPNKRTKFKISPFFRFEFSQVTFYFSENQFLASERKEIYGKTDFLADCGGILGLCLGISVMSLLEIIYFCTMRLWCSLLRSKAKVDDVSGSGGLATLKELVVDYSTKTTIQGLNYMADTDRSTVERFWWTSVVVLSIFCSGSLIFDTVRRFDQSPVTLNYENEETAISEVISSEKVTWKSINTKIIAVSSRKIVNLMKKKIFRNFEIICSAPKFSES